MNNHDDRYRQLGIATTATYLWHFSGASPTGVPPRDYYGPGEDSRKRWLAIPGYRNFVGAVWLGVWLATSGAHGPNRREPSNHEARHWGDDPRQGERKELVREGRAP